MGSTLCGDGGPAKWCRRGTCLGRTFECVEMSPGIEMAKYMHKKWLELLAVLGLYHS